jgi:hypothetical protein
MSDEDWYAIWLLMEWADEEEEEEENEEEE